MLAKPCLAALLMLSETQLTAKDQSRQQRDAELSSKLLVSFPADSSTSRDWYPDVAQGNGTTGGERKRHGQSIVPAQAAGPGPSPQAHCPSRGPRRRRGIGASTCYGCFPHR